MDSIISSDRMKGGIFARGTPGWEEFVGCVTIIFFIESNSKK
jgi:hypothetical protein